MSTLLQRIADRKNKLQKAINQGFEHAMNAKKMGDLKKYRELLMNMVKPTDESCGLTHTMLQVYVYNMEAQNARWIHDHRPGSSFARSHARMRCSMD